MRMQQLHSHNLLTDGLPCFVDVKGVSCEVRTDFRVWLEFGLIAASDKISNAEKAERVLTLCYKNRVPLCREAFFALAEFYRCGAVRKADGASGGGERVLSFTDDAEYIISAFQQEYGIDLTSQNVHWWRFNALIKGLTDNCRLSMIMKYRAADLGQIKDKEKKGFYKKMKRLYALPDTRSEQEKEEHMINQLEKLF